MTRDNIFLCTCTFMMRSAQPGRWWWCTCRLRFDNQRRAWTWLHHQRGGWGCIIINLQFQIAKWTCRVRQHFRFIIMNVQAALGCIIVNMRGNIFVSTNSFLKWRGCASVYVWKRQCSSDGPALMFWKDERAMREHLFRLDHLFFMSEESVSEYLC